MSLRFIVSTLEAVGYDGELYTNSTLQSSATNRQILAVGLRAACPTFLTSTNGPNKKPKFCVRTILLTFPDGKPSAPKNNSGSAKPYNSGGGPRVHSTSVASSSCAVCPGNHLVPDCPQFKSLSADKRGEAVKEKRLCLKCLNTGHIQKDCSRDEVCGVSGCKSRHHPLMHFAPRLHPAATKPGRKAAAPAIPKDSSKPVTLEKKDSKPFTGTTAVNASETTPLLQIVEVILKSRDRTVRTYALLDPGSEETLIRQDIADELALEGPTGASRINTYHAHDPKATTRRVDFKIQAVDGSNSFDIHRAHTVPAMHLKKKSVSWDGVRQRWPFLREFEFPTNQSSEVTVIVGYDHPDPLDIFETRKDPLRSNSPRALLTPFGWCVVGPVGDNGAEKINCNAIAIAAPSAIFT